LATDLFVFNFGILFPFLSCRYGLLALGLNPEQAHGSLRITLGKYTTKKEIDYTIEVLKEAVKNMMTPEALFA